MLAQQTSFVVDDTMDCLHRSAKHTGERCQHILVCCVKPTNFGNLSISQGSIVMTFTSRSIRSVRPVLGKHIAIVVGVCAQKEMLRIHAARIVAMMANEHAWRYGATMQFPRNTMGSQCLPVVSTGIDNTVSEGTRRACPNPTRVRLLDILPKARLDWLASVYAIAFVGWVMRGIIEGHSDLLSRCVKPWGVSAPPGHSVALASLYHRREVSDTWH